jgi:hypothetical protein
MIRSIHPKYKSAAEATGDSPSALTVVAQENRSAAEPTSDSPRALNLIAQDNPTRSGAYIHWNASKVYLDIRCVCGRTTYILDADFCYRIQCVNCGRVYACNPHIRLRPVKTKPPYTLITSLD